VPDNLHTSEAVSAALSGMQAIDFQGPDALAFAHAQFASDVNALQVGRWHWSAWLTAKGRVIAVLLLCRLGEERLLALLPDGDAEEIAGQLRRFVFRRKLTIVPRADLHFRGHFAAAIAAAGNALAVEGTRIELDVGAPQLPRALVVDAGAVAADPAFERRWREADLRLGLPRLEASQREHWTPQQIGLDRLNAYSVKKGCYPGQEIVARTHFLGKAKRTAQLLEVPPGTAAGDEVRRQGQPVGSVASVAGGIALAVLPIDAGDEGLSIGDAAVRALPLVEGLAR